jgi:hypothetical protein
LHRRREDAGEVPVSADTVAFAGDHSERVGIRARGQVLGDRGHDRQPAFGDQVAHANPGRE